jgi:hypothetical protein
MSLIQQIYKYVLPVTTSHMSIQSMTGLHVNIMPSSGLLDEYSILTYWMHIVNEHRIRNQHIYKAYIQFLNNLLQCKLKTLHNCSYVCPIITTDM